MCGHMVRTAFGFTLVIQATRSAFPAMIKHLSPVIYLFLSSHKVLVFIFKAQSRCAQVFINTVFVLTL